MAFVNFSVPDDVKEKFNAAFSGQNKSAVIADLMRRAVEEEYQRQQRNNAIERILNRRNSKNPVNQEKIDSARQELRS